MRSILIASRLWAYRPSSDPIGLDRMLKYHRLTKERQFSYIEMVC